MKAVKNRTVSAREQLYYEVNEGDVIWACKRDGNEPYPYLIIDRGETDIYAFPIKLNMRNNDLPNYYYLSPAMCNGVSGCLCLDKLEEISLPEFTGKLGTINGEVYESVMKKARKYVRKDPRIKYQEMGQLPNEHSILEVYDKLYYVCSRYKKYVYAYQVKKMPYYVTGSVIMNDGNYYLFDFSTQIKLEAPLDNKVIVKNPDVLAKAVELRCKDSSLTSLPGSDDKHEFGEVLEIKRTKWQFIYVAQINNRIYGLVSDISGIQDYSKSLLGNKIKVLNDDDKVKMLPFFEERLKEINPNTVLHKKLSEIISTIKNNVSKKDGLMVKENSLVTDHQGNQYFVYSAYKNDLYAYKVISVPSKMNDAVFYQGRYYRIFTNEVRNLKVSDVANVTARKLDEFETFVKNKGKNPSKKLRPYTDADTNNIINYRFGDVLKFSNVSYELIFVGCVNNFIYGVVKGDNNLRHGLERRKVSGVSAWAGTISDKEKETLKRQIARRLRGCNISPSDATFSSSLKHLVLKK